MKGTSQRRSGTSGDVADIGVRHLIFAQMCWSLYEYGGWSNRNAFKCRQGVLCTTFCTAPHDRYEAVELTQADTRFVHLARSTICTLRQKTNHGSLYLEGDVYLSGSLNAAQMKQATVANRQYTSELLHKALHE